MLQSFLSVLTNIFNYSINPKLFQTKILLKKQLDTESSTWYSVTNQEGGIEWKVGREVQEAGNICMLVAESCCMTEVNTNCNYPPTQNTLKKKKKKNLHWESVTSGESCTDPAQLITLMSLNVPTIQRCLRGLRGTLERALGWIHSSHLCYSALQANSSPHRAVEGIRDSVFWRTGGMGSMGRGLTTQKSCCHRQRASMCSLGLVLLTFMPRNLWDTSAAPWAPRSVTFRGAAPRQQASWWGAAAQWSADTAAQYLVPLCQKQLPDVNPIWHRVLTVVTPCVPTQLWPSANFNLLQVIQAKASQVPLAKSYLILTYQIF